MRYSALITLNFARGNERPGCSLQFYNFIRYCPSGRARGSFCGWVFCVWVSADLASPCGDGICDLLLYAFGEGKFNVPLSLFGKNTDNADAPNGAATSRSRSRWSRAAAAAALWSLRENTPQSSSKAAAGAGPSVSEDSDELPRLRDLCSFLNESGDYCISFIRMRPEKSGK